MEMAITKKDEQINKLVKQIVSNSKDAKWAREMISEFAHLQKQKDDMNKEIDIPLSDVTDIIDFGACALKRYKGGFIFEAKGGMQTVVSWRMKSVCDMCQGLFDFRDQKDKSKEEIEIADNFRTAIEFIFQAPIMSSLDERALFQNATAILNSYNEYCTENYTDAEAPERTEQDYLDDAQEELLEKGVEALVNTPLPPEDIHD